MQAAENIMMQAADNIILAGPDGSFGPVVARNAWPEKYWVRIPVGWDVRYRICAYKVLQTVQKPGVCGAVCGTVDYEEPFKSLDKSRVLSRLGASFCRDIAIIVQKATQSNTHTADIHLADLRLILGLQQPETCVSPWIFFQGCRQGSRLGPARTS